MRMPAMGDPALHELRALSALITSSLNTIDSVLHSRGQKFPAPHELWSAESEAARMTPEIVKACSTIVSAAGQLIATVRSPFESAHDAATQFQTSSCLRTVIQLHVPEILREAGPQGLHASKIAAVTTVDPTKIARILRLLATNHIFAEISPDIFAHNRVSSTLDTEKSVVDILHDPASKHVNTPGFTALLEQTGDIHFKASAYMYEALSDRSSRAESTAFNLAFRNPLSVDQWIKQPDNPSLQNRFDAANNGALHLINVAGATEGLDWGSLPPRSTIVDVAGGIGSQSLIFARAYPQLNFIVQAEDATMANAEKFWRAHMPEALHSGRVKLQAHSAIDPQPLKRPAVFFTKSTLPTLPDKSCITILRHLRDAAAPQTQLIVADPIVSYACPEPLCSIPGAAANRYASAPLLPNLGLANVQDYVNDMTMMNAYNGTERTLSQLQKLLEDGGWRVIRVHRAGAAMQSKIIAIPSDALALRSA